MNDYLVKGYAFEGTVRVYVAVTTHLVEEARVIHDTWPAATAALGRTLTATLIMGALLKQDQSVTVQIDGGGPIGKIVAVADANGGVKGFVTHPHVHKSNEKNKLAVGEVVGNQGFLHVTKDLKVRDLFTSSAELQTGEIGDDFTYYFAISEQIPTSVGLGVLVGVDNKTIASGGYILQILPGASDETIDQVEANIRGMSPISELVEKGFTPEDILGMITGNRHVIQERMDVGYVCDCDKDRFAKGLVSLGVKELDEIIETGEPIETVCHFCGKRYVFTPEELDVLKKNAKKG